MSKPTRSPAFEAIVDETKYRLEFSVDFKTGRTPMGLFARDGGDLTQEETIEGMAHLLLCTQVLAHAAQQTPLGVQIPQLGVGISDQEVEVEDQENSFADEEPGMPFHELMTLAHARMLELCKEGVATRGRPS